MINESFSKILLKYALQSNMDKGFRAMDDFYAHPELWAEGEIESILAQIDQDSRDLILRYLT